jgi:hypothetical protein
MQTTITSEIAALLGALTRKTIVFVSREIAANNADGSLGAPYHSIGEGLIAAQLLGPRSDRPITVVVLDGATYFEEVAVPDYVRLHAPDAAVHQLEEGENRHAVLLGTGSEVSLREVKIQNSSQGGIVRGDTPGLARAYVGTIIVGGGPFAGAVGNIGGASVLFARIETIRLEAPSVFGIIELPGAESGHIHAEIGDLYISENDCIGVARLTAGTTLVRIEHMIKVGVPTGTIGVYAAGGTIDVFALRMELDTTLAADVGATVNAIIAEHVGVTTGAGTIKLVVPA